MSDQYDVRSPDGTVLSTHDNVTDCVRANRLHQGRSQAWCGDVAMTEEKPARGAYGCGRMPVEGVGLVRARVWTGHRRYDPSAWQDSAGGECLARVATQKGAA